MKKTGIPLAYGLFAVFGLAVTMISSEPVHRLWGGCAAVGYGCAALLSLLPSRWSPGRWAHGDRAHGDRAHGDRAHGDRAHGGWGRDAAVIAALAGGLVVPLCWLAASGRGMPEVEVVARSAELLVHHGRAYQPAALLGADVYGYDPYLPGMTLFGLPRALFGGGLATDPRVWDALAFTGSFAAALRVAGVRRGAAARRTALLAGSPLIGFPLAVSGNDLPVIGLVCLGLALAGRPAWRSAAPRGSAWRAKAAAWTGPAVWAGAALGAAGALKATAWPALLIVGLLFAARDGRGAAARFAAAAAAVLALVAGPFLVVQPADLMVNTLGFPLGLTAARSPAASPLPGHLIAATGPVGHLAVVVLLVTAAAVLVAALVAWPPRGVVAAAGYLALTLTVLFTLAPATRWGYFAYPAAIGCWLWLSGLAGGGRAFRGRGASRARQHAAVWLVPPQSQTGAVDSFTEPSEAKTR